MGYYTDLHTTAIIKPGHRDNIKKVVFDNVSWNDLYSHPFVKLWRSALIPFGENKLKKEEIFDGTTLKINCSIKNYEDELDIFFEFLKEISSEVIEYKTFDEDSFDYDESTGKVIEVQRWYNYLTREYENVIKVDI